jgi:hypothetical protein
MNTFPEKHETRPDNIVPSDEVQRRAIEFTRSFVHDLVNQLAVIVGLCDLLSDDPKKGSQSATRVVAIQERSREMAKELNEYECQLSESARSAGMQKPDAA